MILFAELYNDRNPLLPIDPVRGPGHVMIPETRRTQLSYDVDASRGRQDEPGKSLFVSDRSETSRSSDLPMPPTYADRKSSHRRTSSDRIAKPSAPGIRNDMLNKLLITYQKAKKDFDATALSSVQRTKASKFLRDTTENCLSYISALPTPPRASEPLAIGNGFPLHTVTVDEMRLTLKEATEVAEVGSGGKKRRFDEDWTSVPEAPATMRTFAGNKPRFSGYPPPRGSKSDYLPWEQSFSSRNEKRRSSKPRSAAQRIAQSERIPRELVPASSGQGTRRVFPMPTQIHDRVGANLPLGYGDRYRPTYR